MMRGSVWSCRHPRQTDQSVVLHQQNRRSEAVQFLLLTRANESFGIAISTQFAHTRHANHHPVVTQEIDIVPRSRLPSMIRIVNVWTMCF